MTDVDESDIGLAHWQWLVIWASVSVLVAGVVGGVIEATLVVLGINDPKILVIRGSFIPTLFVLIYLFLTLAESDLAEVIQDV